VNDFAASRFKGARTSVRFGVILFSASNFYVYSSIHNEAIHALVGSRLNGFKSARSHNFCGDNYLFLL